VIDGINAQLTETRHKEPPSKAPPNKESNYDFKKLAIKSFTKMIDQTKIPEGKERSSSRRRERKKKKKDKDYRDKDRDRHSDEDHYEDYYNHEYWPPERGAHYGPGEKGNSPKRGHNSGDKI
jgi:hypothetical protein